MLISQEQSEKSFQDETGDLFNALKRIDEEKPNSDDVETAKQILRNRSYVWVEHGLPTCVVDYYIERIRKRKSDRLFTEVETRYIKEQLGYFSANQIEKLIIDQILIRWISVIHIEEKLLVLITEEDRIYGPAVFWQKMLIHQQNLYLKAIETLARVRKLNKKIAFQVNIAANGGQQVNVNEVIKKEEQG